MNMFSRMVASVYCNVINFQMINIDEKEVMLGILLEGSDTHTSILKLNVEPGKAHALYV